VDGIRHWLHTLSIAGVGFLGGGGVNVIITFSLALSSPAIAFSFPSTKSESAGTFALTTVRVCVRDKGRNLTIELTSAWSQGSRKKAEK
jgi:hypothetical protein